MKYLAYIILTSLVVLTGCTTSQTSVNTKAGITEIMNVNESTEVVNDNVDAKQPSVVDERVEKLRYETVQSSCFDFIRDHEFIDPNPVYYIEHIDALEPLTVEWSYGNICKSADKSGYIIMVYKSFEDDVRSTSALEKTNSVYHVDEYELVPDYDVYYHVYHFSDRLMELTSDNITKKYEPGQLSLITELAWAGALAGCMVEPGAFMVDGVKIGCGSGDNGCATIGYANWNILSGEGEFLGQCTNNCDLYPDEAFTLSCEL